MVSAPHCTTAVEQSKRGQQQQWQRKALCIMTAKAKQTTETIQIEIRSLEQTGQLTHPITHIEPSIKSTEFGAIQTALKNAYNALKNSAILARNIPSRRVTQFESSTDSIRAVLTENMSKLAVLDQKLKF
ncbi:MAG: hypothetical protein GY820_48430 [Gammaproteobacteria bacterium]|nr:hypothetical protein [Gammaproteobacteria bacterium]